MSNKRIISKSIYLVAIIIIGGVLMFALLRSFNEKRGKSFHEFNESDFIDLNGFSVDNSQPLEKLLITEYSLEELEMYFGTYSSIGNWFPKNNDVYRMPSWNEVNSEFPVECLRYHKNTHYSVYRVKGGGFFYVIWMVPLKTTPIEVLDQDCPISVKFSIFLNQLPSSDEFRTIKNGGTAWDVFQINPKMEMDFFSSSGVYSYHLLEKGKVLKIKYKHDKLEELNDLIIEERVVIPKEESTAAISSIKESDLPV